MNSTHRKELDGLRGICIISVILYHLEIPFFSGGFLGVDIFFVLSGYLITKILLEKKINIFSFYVRRARRILPALLVFLFIISIFVYYSYIDTNILKNYALSLFANILFISNFFFSQEVNYFNNDNIFYPLLHTWSLAVEIQYYFFYPIILFFLLKYFKNNIFKYFLIIILLNIFLIQFSGNLKSTYPFIEDKFFFFNQSFYLNFFSPLSRIWEFLFGSIICFVKIKKININKFTNFFILPCGYFLIIYSIGSITADGYYPNIYTLPAVIGSCIVLIYENKLSFTYKIITNQLLVFFGLISFSLYLWHYPIIALANYFYSEINVHHKFISFAIFFLLSFFSYNFIEKPFRRKNIINNKLFFYFIFCITTLIIILGYVIYKDDSKDKYVNKLFSGYLFSSDLLESNFQKNEILNKTSSDLNLIQEDQNKLKNILVIGDSHGLDFAMILRGNKNLVKFNNINFYNIELHHFTRNKYDDQEKVHNFLNSTLFKNLDILIIADSMYPFRVSKELENDFAGIKYLADVLKNKKDIILVNQSPYFIGYTNPVKTVLLKQAIPSELPEISISKEIYKLIPRQVFSINNQLSVLAKNYKIALFDMFSIFCDNILKVCSFKTEKNNLLFFDTNHLSNEGIKYMSQNNNFFDLLYKKIRNNN
jgi:peptidoglycan/LPS O-acetylase OafA/YrhL